MERVVIKSSFIVPKPLKPIPQFDRIFEFVSILVM